MKLGMIFARARNGVIGKDGVMPWHLPEDLAHFKQVTMGCPVIMGRKTWMSLPPRFRPLPGRMNIVISRQADWQAEGATMASSLEAALNLCTGQPQVWVIGGGQVYAQAEPLADTVEATEIDADFEGDTFAPELGAQWREARREQHISRTGLSLSFVTYQKIATGD
ncbi:MAG TPA: dihydrofolate reductase [Ramlibacter sp.]|nr:dihydrofolate reductase [Ramlibacter sp.]